MANLAPSINQPSALFQFQSFLYEWDLSGLVSCINRLPQQALAHHAILIFAILRKYILRLKYGKGLPKNVKFIQLIVALRKVYVENKGAMGQKNYFLFQRIQNLAHDVLLNCAELGQGYENEVLELKTNVKAKSYRKKTEKEANQNLFFQMLAQEKHFVQSTECLGCIQIFYENSALDLGKYQQNSLWESTSILQHQEELTEDICALLNSGGGFIFITQNGYYQGNRLEGLQLTNEAKSKYRAFLEKCIRYIEPNVQKGWCDLEFVPIVTDHFSEPNQGPAKWIVKLSVKPKLPKFLYYVSYKFEASEKKIDLQFPALDEQGELVLMEFENAYQKMHSYYRSGRDSVQSKHPGVHCNQALDVAQIEDMREETSVSPNKVTQQSQSSGYDNTSKFKYHLLVIKQKDGKGDKNRIDEIEKQLTSKKILYGIEKIQLKETKTKLWVISYHCLSEVVEDVIKQFNHSGELSFVRARKGIKINDEVFLGDRKDEVIIGMLKRKLETESKSTPLEYALYNMEDMTLNRASKKPVYFKFKNLRHAILCYGLIYASNRRLQFVQAKY